MNASVGARTNEALPPRRSRVYWALAEGLVLAKRNLVQIPRVPELVVFATIQPVMFVLLFRYVFGGAIDVGGTSYVDFLMTGIFVQTVTFGSMTTGIGCPRTSRRGSSIGSARCPCPARPYSPVAPSPTSPATRSSSSLCWWSASSSASGPRRAWWVGQPPSVCCCSSASPSPGLRRL
jgi:hypothetical protein